MFLSHYSKRIQAKDDKQLAWYVDQVEATVGAVGIAEKVRQRYQYIRGKTSQWWLVQKAGIELILKSHSIKGHCVFSEQASWEDLDACLKKGPVILGTKKLGGLAGGHIILIVDKARNGYTVNDPFGEGLYSKYSKTNGHGVFYGKQSLAPYAEIAKGTKAQDHLLEQEMKPLFKPKEYVLLGVLIMIGGIILNAYLPNAGAKILSFMTNGDNSATGPGAPYSLWLSHGFVAFSKESLGYCSQTQKRGELNSEACLVYRSALCYTMRYAPKAERQAVCPTEQVNKSCV